MPGRGGAAHAAQGHALVFAAEAGEEDPGRPGAPGGRRELPDALLSNGAPSTAGVVFQNAALARSPSERVLDFLRLAHTLALSSKCLARSNKSRGLAETTKGRPTG